MIYHMGAFASGFLLDLLFGDPHWLPHPIRLIGRGIGWLESWNKEKLDDRQKLYRGAGMVVVVIAFTALVSGGILFLFYEINPLAGSAMETLMTYQILAVRSLKVESMKVFSRLEAGDLQGARKAVSMIVGRDTEELDETGVAKAAIETVAENTSDGVVAPMLFLALGGPVLGFVYKAVNTMDSMVGYKNEKYLYFGRCAAKLDDIVNYIPSRISALIMIFASFLPGRMFDGHNAARIWKRDRRSHASPNSAQTEAACAGSLGIQLAGDARYFGKTVHKPTLGEARRAVVYTDIRLANTLMYKTAFLCELLCLALLWLIFVLSK